MIRYILYNLLDLINKYLILFLRTLYEEVVELCLPLYEEVELDWPWVVEL